MDKSIVVPMCVTGCDALFEQGWIGIEAGVVIRIRQQSRTAAVEEIIAGLLGKQTSYWKLEAEPYYRWHLQCLQERE